jgi:hypothetical protein
MLSAAALRERIAAGAIEFVSSGSLHRREKRLKPAWKQRRPSTGDAYVGVWACRKSDGRASAICK